MIHDNDSQIVELSARRFDATDVQPPGITVIVRIAA
jgi:hypothetical protein